MSTGDQCVVAGGHRHEVVLVGADEHGPVWSLDPVEPRVSCDQELIVVVHDHVVDVPEVPWAGNGAGIGRAAGGRDQCDCRDTHRENTPVLDRTGMCRHRPRDYVGISTVGRQRRYHTQTSVCREFFGRYDRKITYKRCFLMRFEHRNGFQAPFDVEFECPCGQGRYFVRSWRLGLRQRLYKATAEDVT